MHPETHLFKVAFVQLVDPSNGFSLLKARNVYFSSVVHPYYPNYHHVALV